MVGIGVQQAYIFLWTHGAHPPVGPALHLHKVVAQDVPGNGADPVLLVVLDGGPLLFRTVEAVDFPQLLVEGVLGKIHPRAVPKKGQCAAGPEKAKCLGVAGLRGHPVESRGAVKQIRLSLGRVKLLKRGIDHCKAGVVPKLAAHKGRHLGAQLHRRHPASGRQHGAGGLPGAAAHLDGS